MKYKEQLDGELNKINIPNDALECNIVHCSTHSNELELFHNDVISACLSASKQVVPTTSSNIGRKSNKVKPGWNEYCKEKRDIAMYWHGVWKREGRPHNTFSSIMRRKSRLQYHYVINVSRKIKI